MKMRKLHVRIHYFPWRPEVFELQADEISDLTAQADTIEEGKEKLESKLLRYAGEYRQQYDDYSKDFRRQHHLPYVEQAWALKPAEIAQMIVYVGEEKLRKAVSTSYEGDVFWQQLCSEQMNDFCRTAICLAREQGLRFGKMTEEQKAGLTEQALCELEKKHRAYWEEA